MDSKNPVAGDPTDTNPGEGEKITLSAEDLELLGDTDPNDVSIKDYLEEKRARIAAETEKEDLATKNTRLYARLHPKNPIEPNSTPINKSPETPTGDDRMERIDLRSRGYNEEEIDTLMRYGGTKALSDSIIMAGITEARNKKAAETAAVDITPSGGSELERKYTSDQLRDMPLDELEKQIPRA